MRKPRAKKFNKAEKALIDQTNELIRPLGCEVTGLGPEAVAVMGDARSVGKAIVVTIPDGVDVYMISALITNRVRGIARVLLDVPLG
jgi:hypothetical protein